MTRKQTFTAKIIDAGNGGAFVEVPFDVEKAFGSKRPKIRATIDGVTYRGILARMGGENHILIVLKDIRAQIGKTFGDKVKVKVEADTAPRTLEIPKDLAVALKKDKEARAVFEKLSFTHKREYVKWIGEAKKEETRQRRIEKAMETLKNGQKGK